jgi:hypothetical protein
MGLPFARRNYPFISIWWIVCLSFLRAGVTEAVVLSSNLQSVVICMYHERTAANGNVLPRDTTHYHLAIAHYFSRLYKNINSNSWLHLKVGHCLPFIGSRISFWKFENKETGPPKAASTRVVNMPWGNS